MKRLTLTAIALAVTLSAFGQGTVTFNNRIVPPGGNPQGTVNSPVFGPETDDPNEAIVGATATGDPPGTTTYTGARLTGTGFTAELWGAMGTTATRDQLQPLVGTTNFRTGTGAGWVNQVTATLTGVTSPGRVSLQMRVWDNRGGTITSWAMALGDDTILRGESNIFSPSKNIGFGTDISPNLEGLVSFNVHQVPEPSTIALGILGGLGTLLLLRRRK